MYLLLASVTRTVGVFGKIGQPYAYDIINLSFKNDVAVSFIKYLFHSWDPYKSK